MDPAITQRVWDFGAAVGLAVIFIVFLIKFVEKLFDRYNDLLLKVLALFESNQKIIADNTAALNRHSDVDGSLEVALREQSRKLDRIEASIRRRKKNEEGGSA